MMRKFATTSLLRVTRRELDLMGRGKWSMIWHTQVYSGDIRVLLRHTFCSMRRKIVEGGFVRPVGVNARQTC
jgi:hypothetical protein